MKPDSVLQQLRDKQQYRYLETFHAAGGKLSDELLSFCANDYLNLSQHPEVKESAIYAIRHYGCSAASSRLLSGHLDVHQELEETLARWSGCYEAALSFGSGYLANCGILQAVLGPEPDAVVLFDRLNHASLIDGLRLAGNRLTTAHGRETQGIARALEWQRYKHCDMEDLERRLRTIRQTRPQCPIWLVTESVFSMDGDIAPLLQLAALSEQYQFHWIVDEAHGVGIYGPEGAGLTQSLNQALNQKKEQGEKHGKGQNNGRLPDFVTANLAKALGSYGGYCLCSHQWKEYLVNFCRSLIYSTGLPPASAAAALTSVRIVQRECRNSNTETSGPGQPPAGKPSENLRQTPPPNPPEIISALAPNMRAYPGLTAGLGQQLLQRSILFYDRVRDERQSESSETGPESRQTSQARQPSQDPSHQPLRPLYGPIILVILGQNSKALGAAERLRHNNILVKAIRSPTVPPGTARLRFSLSLAHSEADLLHCAEALSRELTS
ncbi:8-amino-7-oxononanoate synthase [Candidatus Haliotispira prima]|uniref:8-amino-7-oxononanoate synthase n=1 Tax=Candidatus Haliotispira prima TaxID=3034016 RepID=A0ABY8MIR7_9SPIO|nr:8-amino-7-oxononanoate synthase [Candidatus Haliotispira prima]